MASSAPLDRNGAWAVVAGSAVWGLFWWPLRHLESGGLDGFEAIALVYYGGAIAALVGALSRRELGLLRSLDVWTTGFALALAGVLYFVAILKTDVVRVVFLFYLLPVWTILAARILYGEAIRGAQLAVIVIVLTGLWLLLGADGIPWPKNAGDACAIAAGLCWGVSLALLRGKDNVAPLPATVATLVSSALLATVAMLLFSDPSLPPDPLGRPAIGGSTFADTLLPIVLALGFGAIGLLPSMFGQIWGAQRIPAPAAALFTMTEILVATLSAVWLVGTDLDLIGLLGGAVIIAGVVFDVWSRQRADVTPSLANGA